MTPRFIARQLSYPTGLPGAIIGHLMNRRNAKMNHFALEQLKVKATDRVLEIGFGRGVILSPLVENAGFVVGLDRSPDVIRRAGRKFARARAGSRAAFHEGEVEALPFDASRFEKINYGEYSLLLEIARSGFSAMLSRTCLNGPSGRRISPQGPDGPYGYAAGHLYQPHARADGRRDRGGRFR